MLKRQKPDIDPDSMEREIENQNREHAAYLYFSRLLREAYAASKARPS